MFEGRRKQPVITIRRYPAADPMSFYDEYKPFRNYLRRFDLLSSLVDVWRYSLHVMEDRPLPIDFPVGISAVAAGPLKRNLHPWDLDVLARELVLNGGKGGDRSLKKWRDLAIAINYIRDLEEAAFVADGHGKADAVFELHRHAQRQLPWHPSNKGVNPMVRALKVFGETAVESVVTRELGMTMKQFIQLGAAVTGHFLNHEGMSINQDYGVLGISRASSDAFFRRITCDLGQLKTETASFQSCDRDWPYAWNPLEFTPLVAFDPALPDRVLCPIPRYLSRRATGGIFYDLVKSSDFDNPFGNSFQSYVGEIMAKTCPQPRFTLLPEEPYYIGNNKMHGADWVLFDNSGHLFIESKTKRLTLNARILSDAAALEKDINVMALAIVQHYSNIRRALDGHTKWVPDTLPIYPLIVVHVNSATALFNELVLGCSELPSMF
jgi:hypothetical protein